ncbi:MAG: DUF5714 domain-containing protein [Bacteroidales bacterium]|nr:DUF5714 domain-containing protein [Bacteroidales bacterium]
MKTKQSGCLICGADLVYKSAIEEKNCFICLQPNNSNAECVNGHYVCDTCHSSDAIKVIKSLCLNYSSKDPIQLAMSIMDSPAIKMHGPEHHFLVPAVLLTTYFNTIDKHNLLPEKIAIAEERAKAVLGGFCGFYGNCGAGVGTGIYMSIVTGATPLSIREWKLSNLMTANSLRMIAEAGGPRCCKRDTFIAILEAIDFTETHLNVKMQKSENIRCRYFDNNKQCLFSECMFYTT